MIFSSDELTFLKLIAKCPKPFGIQLEPISKNAKLRGEEAKKKLTEKGILKNDLLTNTGILTVRLWEDYCKATKFFICNRCVVALITDRRCVVSTVVDGGYEIASGDKIEVLWGLIKNIEVIRGEKKKTPDRITIIDNYRDFRNRVTSFGENVLSIGVFDFKLNNKMEKIFYWDDNNIYLFNPEKGEESLVDALYVRRTIALGLELNKEEYRIG
ncbi:MAG: DUF5081 family protein [Pseudobutyrivibrio sp.]|uniref:DUF5081 family protein n=1 Tax=Pseudobutyrivibrio sp. TaxID=2014367 RepID=UPI0025EC368D|nr:DUF5081 family protein [Pseudobutyrivibrio sp.]MBQ6464536.1 DUF5081 family protein [Pseudobutyrivibrio sp.]